MTYSTYPPNTKSVNISDLWHLYSINDINHCFIKTPHVPHPCPHVFRQQTVSSVRSETCMNTRAAVWGCDGAALRPAARERERERGQHVPEHIEQEGGAHTHTHTVRDHIHCKQSLWHVVMCCIDWGHQLTLTHGCQLVHSERSIYNMCLHFWSDYSHPGVNRHCFLFLLFLAQSSSDFSSNLARGLGDTTTFDFVCSPTRKADRKSNVLKSNYSDLVLHFHKVGWLNWL